MTINNIKDFCTAMYADDEQQMKQDLYRYTNCGAWIEWDEDSVTIGSIVEGSEAEFQNTFTFPFESEEAEDWIEELEDLCEQAWNEANGYEEDEDEEESTPSLSAREELIDNIATAVGNIYLTPGVDQTIDAGGILGEELTISFFWSKPTINLNWYPICQIDHAGKTILHREGTENPEYWYELILTAMECLQKLNKEDTHNA